MSGQKFEGNGAIEFFMMGFVDDTHATAAEVSKNFVGSKVLPNNGRRGGGHTKEVSEEAFELIDGAGLRMGLQ